MQNIVSQEEYRRRRIKFMNKMLPGSIAIIPAAPECVRTGDNLYEYRQNNDFYYLTGFNEPQAIAVLFDQQYWLFNRPRDLLMETWHGKRTGQEGAEKAYYADKAFDSESFKKTLPDLLKNRDVLYFAFGRQMQWDRIINRAINDLRNKIRAGITIPETIINPEIYIHEDRVFKSPAEIETLQKAIDISIEGHIKAMQICAPQKYEYELQAAIVETFIRNGSLSSAYPPIIGAGPNSCILHYTDNNAQLDINDIVLIDAGCEFQHYASDITRSFPVSGKFSAEQKIIYNIVLTAQLEALKEIKSGLPWSVMQNTVVNTLTEGLISIGLLKGNQEDLIEQKAYTRFYMHSAGHFLGLDTHDAGSYTTAQEWRKLAPGMVLTIEPGLYISSGPDIDKRWWNIGIRIEDDVLITEQGCQILSEKLPKTCEDIEALMRYK